MHKKILLFLLLIPFSVKATCSNQELTRYKTLSSHINTYYTYNEELKKFSVTIYNTSNELKIVNKNNNKEYNIKDKIGETRIDDISPGENLKLAIYPTNGECTDYRTRTIYLNVPHLNKYYEEDVCKDNDHELCQKWANTSIYSKEQFIEKVKKETKEEEIEITPPEEKKDKYGFFDFLADFYIPILLVIIVSGSIAIYFLDKKQKFDF